MSSRSAPNGNYNRNNANNTNTNYDVTQANTLANRGNNENYSQKQRPLTTRYSTLIPPASPTYYKMQEMNNYRQSTYKPQGDGRPADLAHLRPLNDYKSQAADAAAAAAEAEKNATFMQKVNIWMINEGNRAIFFGIWILIHVGLFGLAFFNFFLSDNFVLTRAKVGVALPIARGAALVLNVDAGVILLPVCRTLISWLRSTPLNRIVPFDKALTFHKAIAWSLVFFTAVHTAAHYYNFWQLSNHQWSGFWILMFWSGPGLTGHLMVLALGVIVATAQAKVRAKSFETFWYWHHLFLVFFLLFSFHGAFCLLTPDRPPFCKDIASFWKYWLASGTIYLAERVMREVRAHQRTVISRVILHPSKVVEIQIQKDDCRALAGQYIFLCCPEVSLWQWHPFTLTSAPEEGYISVHMRVAGDFTKELSKRLGCDKEGVSEWEESNSLNRVLPRIMIDGPFGAASEDVFKYEVTVLFGAGIGVTPFASVLKSIWYRVNYPKKPTKLHKVYFFWVCRDKESFEWFQSLLLALESQDLNQFIEIHTFLTGRLRHSEVGNLMINEDAAFADTVTGLRARTCFGRPNLDLEFDRIRANHADTDIGVFFCGPKRMGTQLHSCCTKYSRGNTKFFWNKENF